MAPPDAVTTTISNALPNMFTLIRVPDMPLLHNNNGNELSIRDNVVVDRRRIVFPDAVGAYNFSVMRTVVATCKKNGTISYKGVTGMAEDSTWNIFSVGIPPPIFGSTGGGDAH